METVEKSYPLSYYDYKLGDKITLCESELTDRFKKLIGSKSISEGELFTQETLDTLIMGHTEPSEIDTVRFYKYDQITGEPHRYSYSGLSQLPTILEGIDCHDVIIEFIKPIFKKITSIYDGMKLESTYKINETRYAITPNYLVKKLVGKDGKTKEISQEKLRLKMTVNNRF